jgi:formamidopyrimidine-DNA glycosylase
MPELPEVETIVRDLKKMVLSRTFIDVWTDFPKNIRLRQGSGGQVKKSFEVFRKEIKNRKIKKIWRRGKNILFELSGSKILLVHQKMTGHLLLGKWHKEKSIWYSEIKGPLSDDPKNAFLHIIFFLDNKKQLALSDMRKFAKIELWEMDDFRKNSEIKFLGPEPLDKKFTFDKFLEVFPKKGKIKQVLMNQSVIAGIGNIYSDEILWLAKVHPEKDVSKISRNDFQRIYAATKGVLKKAVSLKGDSFSDYRLISGLKGGYQKIQNVYGQGKKPCPRKDGGVIQRLKIGGRSAHFCPVCQPV